MQTNEVTRIVNIPALIAFGLFFVAGFGVFVLYYTVLREPIPRQYVEIEATISSIYEFEHFDDYEYEVYIDYSFNGEDYCDCKYNQYTSSMKEGDKVKIYVNPDNPEEFIEDSKLADILVPVICGVFVLVGFWGILYNVKGLISVKKENNNGNLYSL